MTVEWLGWPLEEALREASARNLAVRVLRARAEAKPCAGATARVVRVRQIEGGYEIMADEFPDCVDAKNGSICG